MTEPAKQRRVNLQKEQGRVTLDQNARTLEDVELKPLTIDLKQGDGRHAGKVFIKRGERHINHCLAALRYLRFRFQVVVAGDRVADVNAWCDGTVDADRERGFSVLRAAGEVPRVHVCDAIKIDVALEQLEQKRLWFVGDDGQGRHGA